ncbi:MAG TPA: prolyl oligopeptidase family serine peptidase [Terriglobia bacterium]|nr:prolyl oligopeptidase family serine peptidase [Terriglobia bacterium]
MRSEYKILVTTGLAVALCLQAERTPAQTAAATGDVAAPLAPGVSRVTSPPLGKTAGQSRRTGGDPVDDRVELREYGFKDTNENLPYAVFVSSKVTRDIKAPLVLALHGFSGNHGTFMRTGVVDAAEQGGYILVGAMGYSPSGSFGMPFGGGGPNRGRGAAAAGPGGRGGAGGRGAPIGGTAVTDSARVAELSEKDAMNVLEMARKEFNVDDRRIYLMGHSLGGGGSLHMGEKYADTWAAVAPLAPAAFGFQWTAESKLRNVPLLIMQGEADTTVRPAASQALADQLRSLNFQCEIKIMPGLDHGTIIAGAMPEVFKFFGQHTKPAAK